MKSENGRMVVQPGENPIVRQFQGWKGVLVWASVKALTDVPSPDETPVRFTCSRETGGTKNPSAVGVLIAGPYSQRPSAQVISVGDYGDNLILRAFVRQNSEFPVEISWVAWEPDTPPRAVVSDGLSDFLPVGASGSAAVPRVDPWGRTLTTTAPPAATWQLVRSPAFTNYSGPLLTLDELKYAILRSWGNTYDKVAGYIAITQLLVRTSVGDDIEISNAQLLQPGGVWAGKCSGGDIPDFRRDFNPPLLCYFNFGIGTFPQLDVSGDCERIEARGHLLLLPQTTENDP